MLGQEKRSPSQHHGHFDARTPSQLLIVTWWQRGKKERCFQVYPSLEAATQTVNKGQGSSESRKFYWSLPYKSGQWHRHSGSNIYSWFSKGLPTDCSQSLITFSPAPINMRKMGTFIKLNAFSVKNNPLF